jgi:hypothetical protein
VRKALAVIFISFISFLLLSPSAFAETVVIDRITQQEAEDLDIEIPDEVEPGFYTITIQVLDAENIVSDKQIGFCKDTERIVHWDNNCPDLLEKITARDQLPKYNPAEDAKNVAAIAVTAFAAVTALGATKPENEEQDSLEGIEAGSLDKTDKYFGIGDKSITWKAPLTTQIDNGMMEASLIFSRFSPLIARIFADGNYLRAMLGSLSFLLYPIGAYFGLNALDESKWQALPPSVTLISIIMLIGIFDSLAGFIAMLAFTMGVGFQGNLTTRDEILTQIGVSAIFFAPILIASAFRPIRRRVTNFASLWERVTDYFLAALLTGWVVQKMVSALPALAGVQLAISQKANLVAVIAVIGVVIRFVLEDIATHAYPRRTNTLTPELEDGSNLQKTLSNLLKTGTFIFLAEPFIGISLELWLGVLFFALPNLIGILESKFPKTTKLFRVIPSGTPQIILMILIGGAVSGWLEKIISDPNSYLRTSFYLLAIPGLILAFIGFFNESPDNSDAWKRDKIGRYLYRIGGILLYLILCNLIIN